MAVDPFGRGTQTTDSLGNTTYTVYNDPNYETLAYPDWNTVSNTPTGPTEVSREDRPGSYMEALTMTATPHLTAGKPDGTEAIAGIQTVSRDYTNSGGQAVTTDT